MASARPTYIWRRFATPAWIDTHEGALQEQTGGAFAVIERAGRERSVVEVFCETRARAERLRARFGGSVNQLPHDWEAKAFAATKTKPLCIGKRLTIASDAADLPQEREPHATLIIPAGAAFGTGEHATTAMSLRMLERITRHRPAGWRMLDVGTGSGILALAGGLLGASHVSAIDNDPLAISTAEANARQNEVGNVRFVLGDAKRPPRGRFNVISANLYSELLAEALPLWRTSLVADGQLIISGVTQSQEAGLRRALQRSGYAIEERRRRGKWLALQCTRRAA